MVRTCAARIALALALMAALPMLLAAQRAPDVGVAPVQRADWEAGAERSSGGEEARRAANTQNAERIINRRIYYLYPSKFREQLGLAREIQALTRQELGREMRILQAMYGPFGTIVLEFEFENAADQQKFLNAWHSMLRPTGLVEKWFHNVQSGTNELWRTR